MKNKEKSCGCIIFDGDQVLLIRQVQGHWTFPKGHVEEGETEIETATREVKEETNLDVVIDPDKRYEIDYVYDEGNKKNVVFFVANVKNHNAKPQEDEVSEIEWFNFDDAIDTLTYDNTKTLLRKVIKEL